MSSSRQNSYPKDEDSSNGKNISDVKFSFSYNEFHNATWKAYLNILASKNTFGAMLKHGVGAENAKRLDGHCLYRENLQGCDNPTPDWITGVFADTSRIENGNLIIASDNIGTEIANMQAPKAYNLILARRLDEERDAAVKKGHRIWRKKYSKEEQVGTIAEKEFKQMIRDVFFEYKVMYAESVEKYAREYEEWKKLSMANKLKTQEENVKFVKDYAEASNKLIADLESNCSTNLLDRLRADHAYSVATAKPCMMEAFRICLTYIKALGSDPTIRRNAESRKMNDMRMYPNETVASYEIRFMEQLIACIDVGLPVDRKVVMDQVTAGLTVEYQPLRSQVFLNQAEWDQIPTIRKLFEKVRKYEEGVLDCIRNNQKTDLAPVTMSSCNAVVARENKSAQPKKPPKSNGDDNQEKESNSGSGFCFTFMRVGECDRPKCNFKHSNGPAAQKAYTEYLNRHNCEQHTACRNGCIWKKDETIGTSIAVKKAVNNPRFTENYRVFKAIAEPFQCGEKLAEASVCHKANLILHGDTKVEELDLTLTPHSHSEVGMLDNGSNVMLVTSQDLLTDVVHGNTNIDLEGALKGDVSVKVDGWGRLPYPLDMVTAYVSAHVGANLISEDKLISLGWRICESKAGNATRQLIHEPTGRIMQFTRNHEGMLLCDLGSMKRSSDRACNVVCPIVSTEQELSRQEAIESSNSVEISSQLPECIQNMHEQGYSKETVRRALLAGVLHQRLSYMGRIKMIELINANRIADCKLIGTDVSNYFKFLHGRTCIGCMRGKMKIYPQFARDPIPPTEIGEQYAFDEFFITFRGQREATIQVYLGKDRHSGFRNVSIMTGSDAATTVKFIQQTMKLYDEYGHKLQEVTMDPSPAHVAAKPLLEQMGIKVKFCAVGRHVTWVECDIELLKRGILAQLLGLPYRLGKEYYAHAVNYTCDSMNMSFANNPVLTSLELFINKQISIEHFLSAKFGQLVIARVAHGQHKPLASDPLGEYCIVVDRDFSSPGSWYLRPLGPGTERSQIRSRRDFAICDVVTPEVRQWIEQPGEGLTDERGLICHWKSDVPDEICISPTPINVDIDLNEDPNDEFISHGVTGTEALLTTEPNENKLESAHVPEPDGDEFYDDIGEGISRLEANKIIDEMKIGGNRDDNSDLGEVQQKHDCDSMEIKQTEPRYNLRHDRTVRRRLRSIVNRLSILKAKTIFGSLADDSVWSELSQIIDQDTWMYLFPEVVRQRIRDGEEILPSSLFLKEKRDAFDLFEKLKSRLIVCGNFASDDPDIETEAPTASLTILMMMLEISARERLFKRAADIGGAYLYGKSDAHHMMRLQRDVTELLVAKKPELKEYVGKDGCIVVELLKTLYGLKESGRAWYDIISKVLTDDNFTQSCVDKCLFYKINNSGDRVIVVLYVDDMLILSTQNEDGIKVIELLQQNFEKVTVKEGEKLSFLGLEILTDTIGNVKVSQSNYIGKIIEQEGIYDTATTAANAELMRDHRNKDLCDATRFYSIVMKLLFAAVRTRPDILYAVTVLAGRVKSPTVGDRNCLDHILKYLNGTKNEGLVFRSDGKWKVYMSVDASFNHHYDAKGHSGLVVFAAEGSAGILFKSLKQKTVANSSCEAELIALHEGVQYLIWILSVYHELGYDMNETVKIGQDNKATITISSQNPVNFKGRSKFINRIYFSIYEYVQNGTVELVYCGTEEIVADFLTKALIGDKFRKFKIKLMGGSGNNIN